MHVTTLHCYGEVGRKNVGLILTYANVTKEKRSIESRTITFEEQMGKTLN